MKARPARLHMNAMENVSSGSIFLNVIAAYSSSKATKMTGIINGTAWNITVFVTIGLNMPAPEEAGTVSALITNLIFGSHQYNPAAPPAASTQKDDIAGFKFFFTTSNIRMPIMHNSEKK